jgi:hypothetical protein
MIPPELHAACLYDDFEGLLARLRQAIAGAVSRVSLAGEVARFDWGPMAVRYDEILEAIQAGQGGFRSA